MDPPTEHHNQLLLHLKSINKIYIKVKLRISITHIL